MDITHRHTSEGSGQHGCWWLRTPTGEAHGTWRTGTWDITDNESGLPDAEVDAILDSPDFWPGVPADEQWYTATWDGAALAHQN